MNLPTNANSLLSQSENSRASVAVAALSFPMSMNKQGSAKDKLTFYFVSDAW